MATKKTTISTVKKAAVKTTAPEPAKAAPAEAKETQLQMFDRAAKLFRTQAYAEAREVFAKAAEGPLRDVAHNAKLHINMCNRRLERADLQLRSAEDFYNAGVERMNARDFENARRNLERAAELARGEGKTADHIYYTIAAYHALTGDSRGAYENLKRAIDIEPRNRLAARQDPDFAGASQQPPLQGLLYPERTSPF